MARVETEVQGIGNRNNKRGIVSKSADTKASRDNRGREATETKLSKGMSIMRKVKLKSDPKSEFVVYLTAEEMEGIKNLISHREMLWKAWTPLTKEEITKRKITKQLNKSISKKLKSATFHSFGKQPK